MRKLSLTPRVVRSTVRAVTVGSAAIMTLAASGAGTLAGANLLAGASSNGAATYYVSVGDSYSVGFQPSPSAGPTPGYTSVVAKRTGLKLVNFGCGGATTTSILKTPGCAPPYGPSASRGAVAYPHESQVAAATAFIRAHRRHIGLVTVSIGGNDITKCATAPDPTGCVVSAIGAVRTNVAALAHDLREAAGRSVPIIGITYPDVLLGMWVYPSSDPNRVIATLSVLAFKSLFNPALAEAYHGAHATFVDVTQASGAYVPLTTLTTLAPYGTIPLAVARTCALTWYCTQGNIHARTSGYDLIARKILAAYRGATRRAIPT